MSDYDNRQYRLMMQRIEEFEKSKIGLQRLIADLDALLCSLQKADETWRSSFQKEWGVLEEVYAIALDKGSEKLPTEHWDLIDNALGNMKRLLAQVVIAESEL